MTQKLRLVILLILCSFISFITFIMAPANPSRSSMQYTLSAYVRGIASCCSQSHTYMYMFAVVMSTY